jgi:hypothetical protein
VFAGGLGPPLVRGLHLTALVPPDEMTRFCLVLLSRAATTVAENWLGPSAKLRAGRPYDDAVADKLPVGSLKGMSAESRIGSSAVVSFRT